METKFDWWVVMTYHAEKRRFVENKWFRTKKGAEEYAASLPAGTRWKILEY